MADIQDLGNMALAFHFQTGLGAPAAGVGAFGIEVLPSTGLAVAIAQIESGMIKRNRMKRRPRHGPKTVTASYETELSVGPIDPIFEAVLGGTKTAALAFSNVDWGALTISATGMTGTFAAGTLRTDLIVPGMFIRLTGHSTAGNNGKWIPIIDVPSETVLKFPEGYLTDAAADAAYSVEVAPHISTPAQYIDRYASLEEAMLDPAIKMSKYGTDMRFHSINVSVDPKGYVKVGFGLTGRDMQMKKGIESPVFTNPIFIDGDSLILLDGGIYVNGVLRTDLTSLKFGLAATASTIQTIGTNIPPDVSIGQYTFTGDFTGVVADSADFDSFDKEDDISVLLHCKEKESEAFVGFYIGYASFGGYSTPMGGEGLLVQSIPLFAGEDTQDGHAPTVVLISTAPA